ncbi:DinB family protein [Ktedonosporobacter rubrisoli]|uniref:DinB family protein n=1 Tax=Ktedonosporobacter rubrisoli TaxID=2509675 RepID=A0A4P6JKK9_KTERU|nr:DinB family protein [Ktedonosporobacter rubrisoli]QBD75593.1 DinB family protein [Ktedonosporobacter rubrisoli]
MTEQTLPLIMFYQDWESYHRRLVKAIAPLSSDQLDSPVATHHWTIRRLIQHMISDRVWWFHDWLGAGSPELAHFVHWNPGDAEEPSGLGAAELVAALESTWIMIKGALTNFTASDLGRIFSPPASLSEEEQQAFGDSSLQWIIGHVHEHEIHHGGELSLALGGLSLPGVYGNI